ncbi:unnamed protein product [Microthlaspi erraticum]|uniref:Retrotransposon gag domain-containing protein n=1 Tax=Microthlaspi erraticum TaxID=1685480 RepID=A0A6D2HVD5_9BRAS|nr:unnamed protein product [Microthlaspi erraticum]
MITQPSNQQPREESEPVSDDETNRSNAMRHVATTQEATPLTCQHRNTEPVWKSDLRTGMSTKRPKNLSALFEMKQLEDEPLLSYLDRFKSALLDLDEIPGAPQISEPVLVQALGNGLQYESGFWEDLRLCPLPTLKDAFLRAENYIRIEQDIPQLRFDPKDPRIQLRNKRRSSSLHPGKSMHKASRCRHESSPCRDDTPVYDDETGRNVENRGRTERHASPQCAFSDQKIFEIIVDIRRTPFDEPPLRAMRRQKYTSPQEQSAHFYQALAEHLRGDAVTRFSNLRADSIDNFDDLAAAFLKQHLRFALDDLIFCKTDDDTIYGLGKFGFDWEGPFRIAKVVKPGVYQLEDNLGITSDRLWSSSDLRKFHD